MPDPRTLAYLRKISADVKSLRAEQQASFAGGREGGTQPQFFGMRCVRPSVACANSDTVHSRIGGHPERARSRRMSRPARAALRSDARGV